MTTKTESTFTNMFDQAVQTYGEAMKAGVKVQEEAARWFTDCVDQAGTAAEWPKRSRAMLSETLPAAQRSSEEYLKVMEQNYRRSMDLMRKAFDPQQAMAPSEMQQRTRELWEGSLEVMRESAQAVTQANVRLMETVSGIVLKNLNGQKSAGERDVT